MFLMIVIIILITATSILWNIYLWIFSFQKNYNSLDQYQNSYYAAISSIERWMLATKTKQAGFEWSGWFLWKQNRWYISDYSTWKLWIFNQNNNWFYRNINSKTKILTWILRYDSLLNLILFIDPDNNSNNTPYTKSDIDNIDYNIFDWSDTITINLSKNNNLWNIISENDIPIRRKLNISNQNNENYIISDQWLNNNWNNIFNKNINNKESLVFGKNKTNIHPWLTGTWHWFCTNWMCYNPDTNIWNILTWGYATWLILNITWDYIKIDSNNIIPEILYTITSTQNISDTEHVIIGEAIIGNYKKTIIIKKPISTYKNPNRKNFIFPYYK